MQHRILKKWMTAFAISVAVASINPRSPALGADKVKFALPGNSMGYLPLFVAVHRGFFKDEGIDIELPRSQCLSRNAERASEPSSSRAAKKSSSTLGADCCIGHAPFATRPPL